jgi:hypothetical protein
MIKVHSDASSAVSAGSCVPGTLCFAATSGNSGRGLVVETVTAAIVSDYGRVSLLSVSSDMSPIYLPADILTHSIIEYRGNT